MDFRRTALCAISALGVIGATPAPPLQWAFPVKGAVHQQGSVFDIVHRPGSARQFARSALHQMASAPDWFPNSHPPAPRPVLVGVNGAFACGYCHLPNGAGRSENARLQGLPAYYIEEQVRAFASGARGAADPGYGPTGYMRQAARAESAADLKQAAAYFSRLEPRSTTRVVEAAAIPRATQAAYVYRFDFSGREPIGERIVEGPLDWEAFEARDPRTAYTAYVPPGAIARGRTIAVGGVTGAPACASCHGASLAGMGGGSPTYVARQLANFRSRSRNDPGAGPMQAIAAKLSDAQIIDVAAYAASRRPWKRAELAATIIGPAK